MQISMKLRNTTDFLITIALHNSEYTILSGFEIDKAIVVDKQPGCLLITCTLYEYSTIKKVWFQWIMQAVSG